MKNFKLTKEEKQILKDFESGKFESAPNLKPEVKKYQKYADATLKKTKNINIRLAEKDLVKIKSKAIESGLPYQTLLSSLIHQYADGKLTIKI